MIRAANEAGIPIVIYNRPPATEPVPVDDGRGRQLRTGQGHGSLHGRAGQAVGPAAHKAMVLIGDLGDINAVGRRDGFEDAVAEYPESIEVVARVPTEWSQDKALDGVRNALYAHPGHRLRLHLVGLPVPLAVAALKDAGQVPQGRRTGPRAAGRIRRRLDRLSDAGRRIPGRLRRAGRVLRVLRVGRCRAADAPRRERSSRSFGTRGS